jgi:CubicO group peptidase (beta-lactamase class C family)
VAAQAPSRFDARWTEFVADHRAVVDSAGVVGATLAFVRDGEVAAVDYYGMADLAAGRPIGEGTIYHWASITKTFTAVSLMQLRDRGLVALDDAAVETVPELRGVHDAYGPTEDITLGMLLSHSAGFRDPTWPWDGGEDWQPFEPTDWSQLAAMMPYTEILFEPGSRYSYSNPGLIFIGRTIEARSGDVYEAYVDKNIFDALGMETAYFDLTPWRLRGQRSNSYEMWEGEPVALGPEFNTGITVSNGGLNATVADMARWMAFLAGAPAGDAETRGRYDQVLLRRSLEEMWKPVVTVEESGPLGRVEMGLSFFLYRKDGRRLIGHTGSQHSFRSFILVDPDHHTGLIGVYNTAGGDEATGVDTDAIVERTMARAMTELFEPARR